MRLTKLITALVALMLLLSACSTVKLDEAPSIETRKTSAVSSGEASDASKTAASSNSGDASTASSADGISTTGANTDANASGRANSSFNDPLSDPSSILANRSIYFDLDSYIVKDEYKSVIDAHGKYLISRPDRKVIIQGNTDERGGSEYNLALGQKRADAVRRALAQRGVPESQMEAVSYGKEKPKALGSNEEAWKENRRADIAY
jgi:peptidoglycan-associated lipoprotein